MHIGMNQLAALELAATGRATVAALGDDLAERTGGASTDAVARRVIATLVRKKLLTPTGYLTHGGRKALNEKHQRLTREAAAELPLPARLARTLSEYTGGTIAPADLLVHPDPRVSGCYAVRYPHPDGYTADALFTHGELDDPDKVDDVEFASWPPRPAGSGLPTAEDWAAAERREERHRNGVCGGWRACSICASLG